MGEVEGRPDPWQMRVSDADRDKVADILRRAAGEGRLRLDELDERLTATYEARTYADLVPITVDLPAHDEQDRPVPGTVPARRPEATPAVTHASSWAVMGDCKRRGHWSLPAQHTAFSLMGSVLLDLREATFQAPATTINASAVMGDVKVLVDARTHVVVDGVPVMGDFKQSRDRVQAAFDHASPTVHVRGLALMGSVSVVRLPPPGTPRRYLGHY
jgi:hypothetical protein